MKNKLSSVADIDLDVISRPVTIGLEVISHQDNTFKEKLNELLEEVAATTTLLDTPNDKQEATLLSEVHKNIIKLVKDTFGISIVLVVKEDWGPCVLPPTYNDKNVLLNSLFSDGVFEFTDYISLEQGKYKSTVDLKKAKIKGKFSENVCTIFYNPWSLFNVGKNPFTVAEVGAVLTHEIGHCFTFFEYSDRKSKVNSILQHTIDNSRKKDKEEKIEYILQEFGNLKALSSDDIKELKKENNRLVLGMKATKKINENLSSQMPNTHYDQTNSEVLADSFAVRMGYRREITSGLFKLHNSFGDMRTLGTTGYYIQNILTNTIFLFIVVMTATTLLSTLMIGPLIAYSLLRGTGTDKVDATYDDLQDRFTRIRNETIALLKEDKNLSTKQLTDIIADLEHTQTIIDKTRNTNVWTTPLINFIFSKAGAAKDSKDFQQALETLAHNELLVKSTQLDLLTR